MVLYQNPETNIILESSINLRLPKELTETHAEKICILTKSVNKGLNVLCGFFFQKDY